MALPLTVQAQASIAGHNPPHKSSGGNYYFVTGNGSNAIAVEKTANPATTASTVQDSGNAPTESPDGCLASVSNGTRIFIASIDSVSLSLEYHAFNMSTDTWEVTDHQVAALSGGSAPPSGQLWCSIAQRSTSGSQVVICASGLTDLDMGTSYARTDLWYGPSGATPSFTGPSSIDHLSTDTEHFKQPQAIRSPDTQDIVILQDTSRTTSLSMLALRTNTTFSPDRQDGGTTAAGEYHALGNGVAWNNGTTSYVMWPFTDESADRDISVVRTDITASSTQNPVSYTVENTGSAPDPYYDTQPVDENTVGAMGAALVEDGGTIYILAVDSTSQDLYMLSSDDDGATWSGNTEVLDAVTVNYISADVLDTGKVAYLYDDGGTTKYNEYSFPAAITVDVPAGSGTITEQTPNTQIGFSGPVTIVTDVPLEQLRIPRDNDSSTYRNAVFNSTTVLVNTNVTITADNTTAPDGTTTADLIQENTGGASDLHSAWWNSTYTRDTKIRMSVYYKPSGRTQVRFGCSDQNAFFNCTGSGSLGTVASDCLAGIAQEANGWYHLWVTFDCTGNPTLFPTIVLSNGTETVNYAGDGTSGGWAWGAQVEYPMGINAQPVYYPTTGSRDELSPHDPSIQLSWAQTIPTGRVDINTGALIINEQFADLTSWTQNPVSKYSIDNGMALVVDESGSAKRLIYNTSNIVSGVEYTVTWFQRVRDGVNVNTTRLGIWDGADNFLNGGTFFLGEGYHSYTFTAALSGQFYINNVNGDCEYDDIQLWATQDYAPSVDQNEVRTPPNDTLSVSGIIPEVHTSGDVPANGTVTDIALTEYAPTVQLQGDVPANASVTDITVAGLIPIISTVSQQITDVSPSTLYDGLTGVVITVNSINTASAQVFINGIEQSITGTTANTITFTVEISGTTLGSVNLIVREN